MKLTIDVMMLKVVRSSILWLLLGFGIARTEKAKGGVSSAVYYVLDQASF
jgi:hypothetical protein